MKKKTRECPVTDFFSNFNGFNVHIIIISFKQKCWEGCSLSGKRFVPRSPSYAQGPLLWGLGRRGLQEGSLWELLEVSGGSRGGSPVGLGGPFVRWSGGMCTGKNGAGKKTVVGPGREGRSAQNLNGFLFFTWVFLVEIVLASEGFRPPKMHTRLGFSLVILIEPSDPRRLPECNNWTPGSTPGEGHSDAEFCAASTPSPSTHTHTWP